MTRGGLTDTDIVRLARSIMHDPVAARNDIVSDVQRSVGRMNLYSYLAERPGQLPVYTLGQPSMDYARMLVDSLQRDNTPKVADAVADELLRRGGIDEFFTAARPLGEATAQRVARYVFDRDMPANDLVDPGHGVRLAQTLGSVAATFGSDSAVARALAIDLARRFTNLGQNGVGAFSAGNWGRNPLWGREFRSVLESYLAARDANWASLPPELREALE
jgi:hypothetical protein